MNDYNIKSLYEQMEIHLIASMQRNLKRHLNEEDEVGFKFPQWQAEKLRELKRYQRQNKSIIGGYTRGLSKKISTRMQEEVRQGSIEAIKQYNKATNSKLKPDKLMNKSFFKTNDRKVNSLIKVVNNDLKTANTGVLRMVNDQYRQVIHKSAFFAANGVMTEKQAIDMANKDFLSRGINCIEYKNGRRVNIASYSEMAVRTASLRAHLMGEGDFRKSIGRTLVKVTTHGGSCKICSGWQGKVLVDDVYSDGKPDGKHQLLSEAIKQGFLHPNCRHGLTTYYPELEGIKYDESEEEIDDDLQEQINYYDRQEKRFNRLSIGSLDSENKKTYNRKRIACEIRKNSLIKKLEIQEELPYVDITKEWLGDIPNYENKVKQYKLNDTYMYKGNKYKLDGHFVKYSFDEGEDVFAKWLSKLTKKKITLMPKIEYPQKISSPDFKINNIYYDLKTIHGKDKQAIYHKIYGKKEQARRFFFDIADDSSLTMDDLIKQANDLFRSDKEDRNWVEIVGIRKKNKIVILKRK